MGFNYEGIEEIFGKEIAERLKKRILNYVGGIESENKRLKKENKNLKSKEKDLMAKELEIERQAEKKYWEVFHEGPMCKLVSEILNYTTAYSLEFQYEKQVKCNKCNENRQIEFYSKCGKTTYERCDCTHKKAKYFSKEANVSRVEISKRGSELMYWLVTPSKYYDTQDTTTHMTKIQIYEKYKEGNNSYNVYYKTKSECDKHAEFLNKSGDTQI